MGIHLDDILIFASGTENYISGDSSTSPKITGSNNLFYGAGNAPSYLASSVSADPEFVSASAYDFHVQANSPVIDQGKTTSATTDTEGNPRPTGAAFDIGAYEFTP